MSGSRVSLYGVGEGSERAGAAAADSSEAAAQAEERAQQLRRALDLQRSQFEADKSTLVELAAQQEEQLQQVRRDRDRLSEAARRAGELQASNQTLEAELARVAAELSASQQRVRERERRVKELQAAASGRGGGGGREEELQALREAHEARLVQLQRQHEVEAEVLHSQLSASEEAFAGLQAETDGIRSDLAELSYLKQKNLELQDLLDEHLSRGDSRRDISLSDSLHSELASPNDSQGEESIASEVFGDSMQTLTRERASWQWKCAVGRLRIDALTTQLAKRATESTLLSQQNRDLEVQVEALGASLGMLKSFIDKDARAVANFSPASKTSRGRTHSRSSSTGSASLLRIRGWSRSTPQSPEVTTPATTPRATTPVQATTPRATTPTQLGPPAIAKAPSGGASPTTSKAV